MRWYKPWTAAPLAVTAALLLAGPGALAAAGSGTPNAPGSIANKAGDTCAGLALQGKANGSSHYEVFLRLQCGPSPTLRFANAHRLQVDDERLRSSHDALVPSPNLLPTPNRDHAD